MTVGHPEVQKRYEEALENLRNASQWYKDMIHNYDDGYLLLIYSLIIF